MVGKSVEKCQVLLSVHSQFETFDQTNTNNLSLSLQPYESLDYIFKPTMARSSGLELQKSWSQPRNHPVKVGGSKPCFTVTMGVLLSLLAGSDSIYLAAILEKTRIKSNFQLMKTCKILQLKMGNFSPEVAASLFSSSLASFPIQTKTLETMVSSITLLIS